MWIEQSKRSRAWTAGIVLAVMANILPARASANAVDDWNVIANQTIIVNGARPGATGLVDFAYVHLAIYDAVNAIDGRYTVFAVRPTTSPHEASPEAATAAAAYTVLRWLFPAQQASLDGAYAAYLTGLPAGPAKTRGIQVGTEVGNAFVLLRTGDGRNAVVTYALGAGPGVYQFTPGCTAVASPWMATMKTFAVTDSTQFRADGPPNLTSQRWAKDFNETKAYGVAAGSLRSPKQTEVGQFYAENPGAWYGRNVRDIAVAKGLSLADAARFYAQIFVTAADALLFEAA